MVYFLPVLKLRNHLDSIDLKAKFSGPIKPSLWWRYCDDVFDLWQQGLNALHQFTDYINSLYPTIKFELVFSERELHVLDLTLHLCGRVY